MTNECDFSICPFVVRDSLVKKKYFVYLFIYLNEKKNSSSALHCDHCRHRRHRGRFGAHSRTFVRDCGVIRLIDAFTKFRIVSLVAHLIRTNFGLDCRGARAKFSLQIIVNKWRNDNNKVEHIILNAMHTALILLFIQSVIRAAYGLQTLMRKWWTWTHIQRNQTMQNVCVCVSVSLLFRLTALHSKYTKIENNI